LKFSPKFPILDRQMAYPIWRKKQIHFNPMTSNSEEQEVVEIGSPLKFDSNNPWKIKKTITPQLLNLVISHSETFDYILPYWNLDNAKQLVNGALKGVAMWDVINDTKCNEDAGFIFQRLNNKDDDYSLSVMGLFNTHRLGVGDEIGLYWHPRFQTFMFAILSKVCRKKMFLFGNLIETGPVQTIHTNNMMHMTKKITSQDIAFGELRISSLVMFDCILQYWNLELATSLVNGNVEHVGLWDATEQNYGRTNRYEDARFTFRKLSRDEYSLTCMTLINDRGLGVDDVIGLCWNPIVSKFIFKLISKVCRKKTFSNTPGVMTRDLIETTGPAIIFDLRNISYLGKFIAPQNIAQGTLEISSFQTSEYILPYWKLDKAKSLVNGNVELVGVWDVTAEKYGRTIRYEDVGFTFSKLDNLDYSLSCMALINDRGLGVGDEIWLCWNPIISKFIFKIISKVCRKKTFSNTPGVMTRDLIETTGPAIIFDLRNISYLGKFIAPQNIAQGTL
ncbi:hypothetical protein AABB24_030086, partial [Solanum stoloniferum]